MQEAHIVPDSFPASITPIQVQDVSYNHMRTAEQGDLFVTEYGLPFANHLQPENWLAEPWFAQHRRKLRGTSTIYHTQTKPLGGRSLDLVVRFNRVGQDLPIDTVTRDWFTHASFNSPFEEFSQLMALRRARFGPKSSRIPTKRPLAIYSPPTRLHLWQMGRDECQIAAKQARHPEVQLDILRRYIVVYGWIRGVDVQDAVDQFPVAGASRQKLMTKAMEDVEADLKEAGFRVLDMKPAHIIVRFDEEGRLSRRKDGRLVYALVDYELLERDT